MGVIKTQGVISVAFDQNQYITDFKRENYDRIMLQIPKGRRKILKDMSSKKGESMNQLIIAAVEEKYNIDLSTKTQ